MSAIPFTATDRGVRNLRLPRSLWLRAIIVVVWLGTVAEFTVTAILTLRFLTGSVGLEIVAAAVTIGVGGLAPASAATYLLIHRKPQ